MLADKIYTNLRPADLRRQGVEYVVELTGIAIIYVALAKLSLALASIHPSATPIWPPTGYALGAVLLLGYRVSPAIFLGALVANVTTAGSVGTSLAIATGNTLESLVGAYFINRWSEGRSTFDAPAGVVRFALICLPSTMISATLGVGSLSLAGYSDWSEFLSIWTTWWMGDLAGALVIAPAIVLWGTTLPPRILIPSLLSYFFGRAFCPTFLGRPGPKTAQLLMRPTVGAGECPPTLLRTKYRDCVHRLWQAR
jgi:integral membrane sensor domain MASE1